MRKLSFLVMAVVAILLASCEQNKPVDPELESKIIGKWVLTQLNRTDVPTNGKIVCTFESVTKGYISASRVDFDETNTKWLNHLPSSVKILGNKVTLTGGTIMDERYVVAIFDVESITANVLQAHVKYTVYQGGKSFETKEGDAIFEREKNDYSVAILGTWEGQSTGERGSEYDDGQKHRWEYRGGDVYVYYNYENGSWVPGNKGFSLYFVDGTLLCTRWLGEDNKECREWWEIASIENGIMKWRALRQKADGVSYLATFEMQKVEN